MTAELDLAAARIAAFGRGAFTDLLTGRAWGWWARVARVPACRRFLAGALGIEVPPEGGPVTAWPGWAAFAGVARAEFDEAGGWQELPLDSAKVGRLVVTLPVLRFGPSGALVAVDAVAADPAAPGTVARLTGDGAVLGGWPRDPGLAEEPEPIRLHRRPLDWWRAGADGLCLLDGGAEEAGAVLLEAELLCEDEAHAAEVYELQRAWRQRLIRRLPKAPAPRFPSARRAA